MTRDRIVILLARIILAVMIVVPPVVLFQWANTNQARTGKVEQAQEALTRDQKLIAQERIDRTITDCHSFNELRTSQIATSEALVKVATSSPPDFFTDRDRLLLSAFVQRANKAIESATHPKTCTVQSLGLQSLTPIAHGG